jgi:hypothetical protein
MNYIKTVLPKHLKKRLLIAAQNGPIDVWVIELSPNEEYVLFKAVRNDNCWWQSNLKMFTTILDELPGAID